MSEVDLHAIVKEHSERLNDHEGRLDDHEEVISRHSIILEQLKNNIVESRASLTRIETKLDGTVKDALNAIPVWLGVLLALLALMVAAMQFGRDLWPAN